MKKRSAVRRAELSVCGIPVAVNFKNIKNYNLYVRSPDGRVELSAPSGVGIKGAGAFLHERAEWIARQRDKYKGGRQAENDFSDGGFITLFGKIYTLRICDGNKDSLTFDGGAAVITLHGYNKETAAEAAERVYLLQSRRELADELAELVPLWEGRTGLRCAEWHIKDMKSRWGSCNSAVRRLWFALRLARRPRGQIEYVVAHELTHIAEANHGPRFYARLSASLPDWKERRAQLNSLAGS